MSKSDNEPMSLSQLGEGGNGQSKADLDSVSQANGVPVDCTYYSIKASHRSAIAVNCAACSKPALIACLAHKFKTTGELSLKKKLTFGSKAF